MIQLKISLVNCFGIKSLNHEFDFDIGSNPAKPKAKAYAIYAPNGLMKSSFAKTFDALSKGEAPKEERYNRPSTWVVEADGAPLPQESIFVLRAELDISADCPAMTNILVNPEKKARYDSLLFDLEELKNKLINGLQKVSRLKKIDIEQAVIRDFGGQSFPDSIEKALKETVDDSMDLYEYAMIFDPKAVEVLKSQEFIAKADEFNNRYQELFSQEGTLYQKGIFNPTKAEVSFSTLEKQGFFAGGHRVHLRGDTDSLDKTLLDQKIQAIHSKIDADETLKKIRLSLAKNAQTQALADLIERLDSTQVEILLEKLKPENLSKFRRELWTYYFQNSIDGKAYIAMYAESKEEIAEIERSAAQDAPRWTAAVSLFNGRFFDMPFTLSVANQAQASLGKENAKLKFTFKDGPDAVEWLRPEVKTLSQGEKRALYLLNFIFEVEARKLAGQETLFIIDDVADSFDYKNKHAIVQYLDDLCNTKNFHQIILTHNFDFFRSVAGEGRFVNRTRCLMANKETNGVSFSSAEGVNNIFTKKWKPLVNINDKVLCATIPFTRNLIEYTKGTQDTDYLKLTSLLHWKNDTDQISIGNYLDIYNRLFNLKYDTGNTVTVKDLLFTKADEVCSQRTHEGLNLEDKVLLSIAIRLKAEILITERIRSIKNDADYWCQSTSQFGGLMREFIAIAPNAPELRTLEKVSITVSSNIHLNAFMYEPILDLTIDHLIALYGEVAGLVSSTVAQ